MANEVTTPSFFGKAKYGKRGSWKNFRMDKEGDYNFRFAPPVKSLAAKGIWSLYYRLHWGYGVPDKEGSDQTQHRTFLCVEKVNRRTEMIEVECEECTLIAQKREEYDATKKKLKDQGKTEEEVEASTGALLNFLMQHNLDKKYYVFAKNTNNEWGVLYLSYKAWQPLQAKIEKLQKEGIDPLDPDHGVWFTFTKTGKKLKTEFTVDVVTTTEIINGRRMMNIKEAPLTAEDAAAIERDLPDLATINDNKRITPEQVSRLVRSGGNPDVVTAVFDSTMKKEEKNGTTDANAKTVLSAFQATPESVSQEKTTTQAQPEPAKAEVAQQTTPSDPQDEMIAQLQASLAKALADRAKKAPQTTVVAAPNPTMPATQPSLDTATKTTVVPATGGAARTLPSLDQAMKMSTEEFMGFFPDPNVKA